MNLKKTIAVAAAVLMLLPAAVSCSTKETPGNNTSKTTTAGSNDTTAAEVETNPYVQDDGLPDTTFDGQTFIYLTCNEISGGEMAVMDYEEVTNDQLLDSIHYRTQYVEERFDIEITDNTRSYSSIYNLVKDSVLAEDYAFNACYGFVTYMFPLSVEGNFIEFTKLPNIDLDKPWWDQNAKEAFAVGGRLYYMVGDGNMFYNDYTSVLYFNKELMDEYNDESPYDLVKAGTWTVDKMYEMGINAVADLNNDNEITKGDDRFGMICHSPTDEAFLLGCGVNLFELDNDGYPTITTDSDNLQNACEAVAKLFTSGNFMNDTGGGDGSDIQIPFMSGQALFAGEVLQAARRYRAMETNFGILPFPKLNEQQEDYITHTFWALYPVAIPAYFSNEDLVLAGCVMEAIQSASHNTVRSAYFDTALTSSKFLRDTESDEMLDIIFNTRLYPLSAMKDFGGIANGLINNVKRNNGAYTSLVDAKRSKAETEIGDYIDQINQLP